MTPTPPAAPRAWIAAAALVLAALAVAWSASGVIDAALAPSPGPATDAESKDLRRADRFHQSFEGYLAQVRGRSLFVVPSPPPPKPAEARAPDTRPTPPPSRYDGPALLGMVNDVVWFADGTRLKPGEEAGALRVVRIEPPWSAVVAWKDAEFTVLLFARDAIVTKPDAPASTVAPPPTLDDDALTGAPPDPPVPGSDPDGRPSADSSPTPPTSPTPPAPTTPEPG